MAEFDVKKAPQLDDGIKSDNQSNSPSASSTFFTSNFRQLGRVIGLAALTATSDVSAQSPADPPQVKAADTIQFLDPTLQDKWSKIHRFLNDRNSFRLNAGKAIARELPFVEDKDEYLSKLADRSVNSNLEMGTANQVVWQVPNSGLRVLQLLCTDQKYIAEEAKKAFDGKLGNICEEYLKEAAGLRYDNESPKSHSEIVYRAKTALYLIDVLGLQKHPKVIPHVLKIWENLEKTQPVPPYNAGRPFSEYGSVLRNVLNNGTYKEAIEKHRNDTNGREGNPKAVPESTPEKAPIRGKRQFVV